MSDLLIPYALSGSGLEDVFPDRALRGGDYKCPECFGKVGIKIPTVRRAHFFHYPPYANCALNPERGGGEGLIHAQAKHILYAWLLRWLSDEIEIGPTVTGMCATHCRTFTIAIPKPSPFNLRKEYELASGRRLDVALLNSDCRVTMGFEIKSKHAVTAAKAEELPARCVELRAESIIEAYERLLLGNEVPAIKVLRWAEYDQPSCCRHRPLPHLSRSFGQAAYAAQSTLEPAYVREPVKQEPSDTMLMSAAGKACSNGQTPKNFASSYAALTGKSETAILRRLQEYGIAKSEWGWT